MDNFIINVVCTGRAVFDKAVEIAFIQDRTDRTGQPLSGRATHYAIDPDLGMVLLRHEEFNASPLPFPMEWGMAATMAWEWLRSMDDKDFKAFETAPDHDGHNSRGWRVYCDFWGHVGKYRYAICAVKPAWAWHGK